MFFWEKVSGGDAGRPSHCLHRSIDLNARVSAPAPAAAAPVDVGGGRLLRAGWAGKPPACMILFPFFETNPNIPRLQSHGWDSLPVRACMSNGGCLPGASKASGPPNVVRRAASPESLAAVWRVQCSAAVCVFAHLPPLTLDRSTPARAHTHIKRTGDRSSRTAAVDVCQRWGIRWADPRMVRPFVWIEGVGWSCRTPLVGGKGEGWVSINQLLIYPSSD